MTSQPLVPDPYETAMVEVRQSSVPGAEEGLFARHEYLEYFLAFKLDIVNVTGFSEPITFLTRRDVVPDTVLAFYNGVRSQRQKDGPQTWQNEANAYKIFDPTCKEGIVNIPPEVMLNSCNNKKYKLINDLAQYHQLSSYCASLAHKTNHSFVPNCEFGEFFHPR